MKCILSVIFLFFGLACTKNNNESSPISNLPRISPPADSTDFIGLYSKNSNGGALNNVLNQLVIYNTKNGQETLLERWTHSDFYPFDIPKGATIVNILYLGSVPLLNKDSIKQKTGKFVSYSPDSSLIHKPIFQIQLFNSFNSYDTTILVTYCLTAGLIVVETDTSQGIRSNDSTLTANFNSYISGLSWWDRFY